MVADFAVEGAVWLEFGGTVSVHLVHFITAVPREVDAGRLGAARGPNMSGAAAEGELAPTLVLEQDIAGSTMSG